MLLLPLVALSPALAAPLNPWGAHVGDATVTLTPFVFVDGAPGVYPYVYGQVGLTPRFELLAGVGGTLAAESGFDHAELMPRWFLAESTAVALGATWNPGVVALNPQLQGVYELGWLTLTANLGADVVLPLGGGAAGLEAWVMVAPEWYFTEASSIFLELDARRSFDTFDVSAELIPGVSTAFADTHFVAVGVGLPLWPAALDATYVGAWYSVNL